MKDLSHYLSETVLECSHLLLFICPPSTSNITNLNMFPVPFRSEINMFRGGDNRWEVEVEAHIYTFPQATTHSICNFLTLKVEMSQ